MPRIATAEVQPTPGQPGAPGGGDLAIRIRLVSGEAVEGRLAHAVGSPARPLTDEQLLGKVAECLAGQEPRQERAEELFEACMSMDRLTGVDRLLAPLRRDAGAARARSRVRTGG